MASRQNWHGRAYYRVTVSGHLDNQWSDWFGGMTLKIEGEMTVISGEIADQAELRGVIDNVMNLGLPLVAVERVVSD